MARFVRCLRRSVFSDSSPSIAYRNPKIGLPTIQNRNFLIGGRCLSSGSYVSEMQKSAFQGNICRLIRNEIDYELNHSPPLQVIPNKSYSIRFISMWLRIDHFWLCMFEQWISLTRKYGEKGDIKVEATMFDRSVPSSKSTSTEPDFILHITFLVKMWILGS